MEKAEAKAGRKEELVRPGVNSSPSEQTGAANERLSPLPLLPKENIKKTFFDVM